MTGHDVPCTALTVAMPVYNEEDVVALAVEDVQRDVLDVIAASELIVVNDGSTDRTGPLLDEMALRDPRIRVIHQENRGHGGALMAALATARGEFVFLVDADRQIMLSGFEVAWAQVHSGRDGVFGVRRERRDPLIRLWLTRVIQVVIHLLFGVACSDANVPYKLIRRSIWCEARTCIPDETLAPSLFLAIFARIRGYAIVEIDVVHKARDTGEESIRRLKLLKFCLRAFRQLMAFRRCVRHA